MTTDEMRKKYLDALNKLEKMVVAEITVLTHKGEPELKAWQAMGEQWQTVSKTRAVLRRSLTLDNMLKREHTTEAQHRQQEAELGR